MTRHRGRTGSAPPREPPGRASSSIHARRRLARVSAGLTAALALGLLTACGAGTTAEKDEAHDAPVTLQLGVTPRRGEAPLTVQVEARLVGEPAHPERFGCPSVAWDFGNDDILIAPAPDCAPGEVGRLFHTEYTYHAAGTFEVAARLLAVDAELSAPVQVLVAGPTPTVAAVAAVPGPTIIIATAAPRATLPHLTIPPESPTPGLGPAATAGLGPAATAGASAPPGRSPVPIAGTPLPPLATARPAAGTTFSPGTAPAGAAVGGATGVPGTAGTTPVLSVARVLPADLYFLTAAARRLHRISASGGAPLRLDAVPAPVDDYALSAGGVVACLSDGVLTFVAPGMRARTVRAAGVQAIAWSRDGRRLAYGADGVWIYDLVQDEQWQLTAEGSPVAWSAAGDHLLARGREGEPILLRLPDGEATALPLGPFETAGWLPDRPVAWLVGPGLRLLTAQDTLALATILDPTVPVRDGFVRPDLRLLVVADAGSGPQVQLVDLTAPMLTAGPLGAPLDLAATDDLAWAPDGRTAAVAGPGGLELLDPLTGAVVPLVAEAAARPLWLLAAR